MAKFNYNDSLYAKLWNSIEGKNLLTYMLNDPNMIRENPAFWKQDFEVDPQVIPTSPSGTASFTVTAKEPTKATMMHWRAPLGDSIQKEQGAAVKYSGSIIDFIADGYVEQAMEREYKARLIEQYGNENLIIATWATDVVAEGIRAANYTLSNMAAQALSKGNVVYDYGKGIHGAVYKADIPIENFCTAGIKVWADPDCEILTQMVQIEKKYRETVWGKAFPMIWEIPYDTFHNVLLKNKQVVDWAKQNMYLSGRPVLDNMIVQEKDAIQYLADFEGLSPIRVITEKQYDDGAVVSGWASGKVVLRPSGYAGKVLHTDILDERLFKKYGSNILEKVFATTMDGLVLVANTVKPIGEYKEWHTDFMMSAVPVLDDFLYHVIVDITTADS